MIHYKAATRSLSYKNYVTVQLLPLRWGHTWSCWAIFRLRSGSVEEAESWKCPTHYWAEESEFISVHSCSQHHVKEWEVECSDNGRHNTEKQIKQKAEGETGAEEEKDWKDLGIPGSEFLIRTRQFESGDSVLSPQQLVQLCRDKHLSCGEVKPPVDYMSVGVSSSEDVHRQR